MCDADECKVASEDEGCRLKFGSRYLTSTDDVFRYNAWDKVEWDDEQQTKAEEAVFRNCSLKMDENESIKYRKKADVYWNSFYNIHQNRFFKDRYWLFTEFSELNAADVKEEKTIFEVCCGVGNTIFPILRYNTNPYLKIYGCDFSLNAVEILKSHPEFDANRCNVFLMDATLKHWNVPFNRESLDIIVLIFALSAIEPINMQNIADNCYKYLKKDGIVLFRDYGRYDLAQLRFKPGKCLEDNLYVRGDGTMVYFFTQNEVRDLFLKAGFVEMENVLDKRLQVNRSRMSKMYRVWIQAKFQKSNKSNEEINN